MKSLSPTTEGFRAAFRRPSFTFAEITWRWAFWATAGALFVFYGVEFLDTLPVTNTEALLVESGQPWLILQAIQHILRGSFRRATFGASLAVLLLAVLWIIAASIGRLVTTRSVLEYFHRDSSDDAGHSNLGTEYSLGLGIRPLRALIDLNFLRVAVLLAILLALIGSAILTSMVSTEKNPRADLAVILFLLLAVVIFIAGWVLNWWLSFAEIFAVRNGDDAIAAFSTAATLARNRAGAVLAVSTWTGLAHLVALSIASSTVPFVFALTALVPGRVVLAGFILISLTYFAVVDWLYTARMAGYIYIAEMPETLSPLRVPTFASPESPLAATIDGDEVILSDVPGPAVG
jgi:hypothetical protein